MSRNNPQGYVPYAYVRVRHCRADLQLQFAFLLPQANLTDLMVQEQEVAAVAESKD